MKKAIISVLALCAAASSSFGQARLASLRFGGVSAPTTPSGPYGYEFGKDGAAHWSAEAGYGVQRRNGLRFDLTLRYFNDHAYTLVESNAPDYSGGLKVHTDALGAQLSAGYNLMQFLRPDSRFRLTAGLALQPVLFSEKVNRAFVFMDGSLHREQYRNSRIALFGGLQLNPEYRIAKHWWLSGQVSFAQRLTPVAAINERFEEDLSTSRRLRSMTGFSVGIARQF